MAKKETEIKRPEIKRLTVRIEGDGDLILNKMNRSTQRELIAIRNDEYVAPGKKNMWDDVLTSIHLARRRA